MNKIIQSRNARISGSSKKNPPAKPIEAKPSAEPRKLLGSSKRPENANPKFRQIQDRTPVKNDPLKQISRKNSRSKSSDIDRSLSLVKIMRSKKSPVNLIEASKLSSLPKYNSQRELSPSYILSTKPPTLPIINDYSILKEIGHGSYATVYRAEYIPTKTPVAIKIYKKATLTQTRENSIKHELHVLLNLDHPNVVKFIDCFTDKDNIYLVMELIKGKNLYVSFKQGFSDLIADTNNKLLRKTFAKNILKQLTSAVAYLHSQNVNHRDIKLDNIVFDPDKKQIKLIDFGFSKKINPEKLEKLYCGTPSYMSPEAIVKEEFKTLSGDIWAMGVVYYALLFFKFPFNGTTDKELYNNIINQPLKHPDWASKADINLLEAMLTKNWTDRIDAKSLQQLMK